MQILEIHFGSIPCTKHVQNCSRLVFLRQEPKAFIIKVMDVKKQSKLISFISLETYK